MILSLGVSRIALPEESRMDLSYHTITSLNRVSCRAIGSRRTVCFFTAY